MSWKDRFRSYPLFSLLFLVSCAAVVIPVWVPEYLPLVDWPQHLAVVSVLAEHGNPAYGFDRYIDVGPFMTTYMTFYGGAALLAPLFGIDGAARLLLCFFFVGAPLSLAYLLRSMGRAPHPALAAFPVTYCWSFYFGFASYLVSLPLLFFALGLVFRQAKERTWVGGIGLALMCIVVFFTHAFTYLVLGLCMLLVTPLATGRRFKRLMWIWASGIPSLLCFGYWYAWNRGLELADEIGAGAAAILEAETVRGDFKQKLGDLPGNLNNGLGGTIDETLRLWWWRALLLLFVLGCCGVIWRSFKRKKLSQTKWFHTVAIALILSLLYFAVPISVAGVWAVSARVVVLAAFGLTLVISPISERRWLSAVPYLPMVALTVWVSTVNISHFQEFDEEASGLTETLDAMESGQRVYGLMNQSHSQAMDFPAFLHFPCYYMVRRGGIVGFTFFRQNPSTPLRVRNLAEVPNPGRRSEWEPQRFRNDVHSPFYDGLLIRGSRYHFSRPGGTPSGVWDLVAQHGNWAAFSRSEPSRDVPMFSFLQGVHRAHVTEVRDGQATECSRDGLRASCPNADWTWIGPSLQTFGGVSLECIWAHPFPQGALVAEFDEVPAEASVIRGFLGIADGGYEPHNRGRATLSIAVNGATLSVLETLPRRGYHPFEIEIPPELWPIEVITFTAETDAEARNQLCFNATLFATP